MNDVIIPPPHPFHNFVQRGKTPERKVLVAKGMETCGKVSCSTSLSSMLQKEAKTL